jgi:hypothetical protein
MAQFGLKVVPGDWELERPLGFSEAEYQQFSGDIVPGMRILIYKSAPVNAIISEGEVKGTFIHTAEWPQTTLHGIDPTDPHSQYLLPITVIYRRAGPVAPIPLHEVRERLHTMEFPPRDSTFMLVDKDYYVSMTGGWV